MSGRTNACLKTAGISAFTNDLFTMLVIIGHNSSMHSFTRDVGNGSSSNDFVADLLRIRLTSSTVRGLNDFKAGKSHVLCVSYLKVS